jgi:hypothetical protein
MKDTRTALIMGGGIAGPWRRRRHEHRAQRPQHPGRAGRRRDRAPHRRPDDRHRHGELERQADGCAGPIRAKPEKMAWRFGYRIDWDAPVTEVPERVAVPA